jgi:hypothetical protein
MSKYILALGSFLVFSANVFAAVNCQVSGLPNDLKKLPPHAADVFSLSGDDSYKTENFANLPGWSYSVTQHRIGNTNNVEIHLALEYMGNDPYRHIISEGQNQAHLEIVDDQSDAGFFLDCKAQ